jgi:hypothetical protein
MREEAELVNLSAFTVARERMAASFKADEPHFSEIG